MMMMKMMMKTMMTVMKAMMNSIMIMILNMIIYVNKFHTESCLLTQNTINQTTKLKPDELSVMDEVAHFI